MTKAENTFETLKDAFDYAVHNHLRLDMAEGSENEAVNMHGAVSYLIDKYFAKEGAGEELTRLCANEMGTSFKPERLAEETKKINAALFGDEFASGKSALRDYVAWIATEKMVVLEAFEDNAGRLALSYIDELTTLVAIEHPEVEKLRIAEILFLYMTEAFARALRHILGKSFEKLASSPYFMDVEEEFELIRSEIDA